MPKTWAWNTTSSGGGSGEPTGPAGGSLKGEYPNPTLASEAVKAEYIEKEAVETAKVKLLAITAALLGAESVETAKIKNLAVTAAKLAAESVETAKIKLLAVESGQLGAEAVTAAKIATSAVEEAKIKAEAVTEGKLATGAVTAAKIGAAAVETAKIKNAAVTKEKLSATLEEELAPKVIERSFAIAGEVKNEVYPGFFVKLGTGEEKKLIGIQFELLEGTSVELELQKANEGKSEAAAGIAGYKVTECKAEKKASKVSSVKTLANEDRITLKCSSGSGTPKGLICTLFLESVK